MCCCFQVWAVCITCHWYSCFLLMVEVLLVAWDTCCYMHSCGWAPPPLSTWWTLTSLTWGYSPVLHTASNQKLVVGRAWEQGYHLSTLDIIHTKKIPGRPSVLFVQPKMVQVWEWDMWNTIHCLFGCPATWGAVRYSRLGIFIIEIFLLLPTTTKLKMQKLFTVQQLE